MKCLITLFFLIIGHNLFAGTISQEEINFLNNKEFHIDVLKIKDETWPKITIYRKISATPLESIAIFLALDYQKNYLPNVLESTPVRQLGPRVVYTRYKFDLPWPIPNSVYIHSSTLNNPAVIKGVNKSYSANWAMIESDSTEKVDGSILFYPLKNQTIMRYQIFVRPSSFIASLLEKSMIKDVKKATLAIKHHIEYLKENKKDIIKKYISYINRSLNGEYVYIKKKK